MGPAAMRTTAVATRQAVKTNKLPQLQGGHVSHKTFSKSTPHQLQGGHCPTKRSLRAPLQCVPVKIQEIKIKTKCHSCRGGTSPTKRQIEFLCSLKSTPPVCQNQRNQIQKTKCKLANGSHQSRCIQFQDVQCAQDLQIRSGQ